MAKWIAFTLSLLLQFQLLLTGHEFADNSHNNIYLGSREGDPASLVRNVSVIHGDYSEVEVDLVVSAPTPIILSRYYSSQDLSHIANLGGWRFYPQCFLYLKKDPEKRSFISPNGQVDYTYVYVGTSEGSILTYTGWKYPDLNEITQFYLDSEDEIAGLANTARGNINSWTNLKNNTLYFYPESNQFELFLCSGVKRIYVKSPNCYLLEREIFPNGNQAFYEYDSEVRLKAITMVNASEEKVLAWVKIHYDSSIYIEASDGQTVSYEFENSYLSRVIRSYKPSLQYQYEIVNGQNLLKRKELPEGRFIDVDYYLDGPHKNRVQSVTTPTNQEETVKTEFFYVTQRDGGGVTEVIDPLNRKTVYYYNDYFELESIEDYLDEALYRVQKTTWGERKDISNLTQTSIEDANGSTFYVKAFSYDEKGNILEEREYGSLTEGKLEPILLGRSGCPLPTQPCYTKTYKYEKVREQDQSEDIIYQASKKGTGLSLVYYPDSPILKRKEFFNWGEIKKRYFYEYNGDGVLTSISIDNGPCLNYGEKKETRITRFSPKSDFPNLGALQIIEEIYLESKPKAEILIKKTVNHFDSRGFTIAQDIYDSQDQLCYTLTLNHDDAGRPTSLTNPMGVPTYFSYDSNGNLIEKQEKEKTTTYSFDLQNRLIGMTVEGMDGSYINTQKAYDAQGNKTLEIDHLGNKTIFKYDKLGRLITLTSPPILTDQKQLIKPTYTYKYNFLDHLICITDLQGNEAKTTYNIRKQPTLVEHPDGSKETFIYTLDGSLYQHTFPNNTTAVFEYDYLGHIRSIKSYPKNAQSSDYFNWDHFHYTPFDLAFKRDQDSTTQFIYDGAGRLIQSITSEDDAKVSWSGTKSRVKSGRKIDYTYDNLGRVCVTKTWKDKDHFTLYKKEYNLLNQMTLETIENEKGKILFKKKYAYDDLGRLIQVIGFPNNQESILEAYTYDSFDRIVTTQKNGSDYRFEFSNKLDSFGQHVTRTTKIDPLDTQEEESYSYIGQLTSLTKRNATQGVLSEETYFYDPLGHLTLEHAAVIANGKCLREHETTYTYTPTGSLETKVDSSNTPEKLSKAFLYNNFNEFIEQSVPNFKQPIQYHYDSNGRLSRITYQEKPKEGTTWYKFSYDNRGRVNKTNSNSGSTLKRTFNNQSQILSETIQDGFGSYTLSYEYDKEGCLIQIKLPDHTTIEYTYEGPFVKTVARYSKDHQELYQYNILNRDLMGNILEEKLPGHLGIKKTHYDQYGRKTALITDFFTEEVPLDGFDLLGNMTQKNTTLNRKAYQTLFNYGPLSELLSEKGVFTHTYEYDSLENRISKNSIPYKINALNQTIQTKDAAYTYDSNGNLASTTSPSETTTFEFDALGRLLFTKKNHQEFLNTYDYLGRRLTKQTTLNNNTQKTLRHFYLDEYLLGSINEQGEIVELRIPNDPNIYEKASIIVIEVENTPYTVLTDLQGNVRCLVDPTHRKVLESYHFSAFGEEEIAGPRKTTTFSLIGNPWRYQSQYQDEENGLIYFGKRYYDPQMGKWISPDPLGSFDSPNLYSFCHNNPIRYQDNWGLFSIDKSCGCIHHNHPGFHSRPSNCICICGQHEAKLSGIIHGIGDFAIDTWNNPRFQGGLQAFGGLTEAIIVGGMALGSGGVMAPVGGIVMAHGLDHFFSGLQIAFSGIPGDTVTSQLLQKTGMSSQTASLIDGSISIVGSLGGTAMMRASQLAAFPNFRLPVNIKPTSNYSITNDPVKLWPSPSNKPQIINNIEYVPHAVERMAPHGLIQNGIEIVSRGIPPSVVENAIKFGIKIPGNKPNTIVHIFENVKVVTNSENTRVITVITTGR